MLRALEVLEESNARTTSTDGRRAFDIACCEFRNQIHGIHAFPRRFNILRVQQFLVAPRCWIRRDHHIQITESPCSREIVARVIATSITSDRACVCCRCCRCCKPVHLRLLRLLRLLLRFNLLVRMRRGRLLLLLRLQLWNLRGGQISLIAFICAWIHEISRDFGLREFPILRNYIIRFRATLELVEIPSGVRAFILTLADRRIQISNEFPHQGIHGG